jgi:hypothetical protein
MNRQIRGAVLGGIGLGLMALVGCENNEANVKGQGVTPPGAAATSDAGAKVAPPTKANSAPPKGYMDGGGSYNKKDGSRLKR